MEYSPDQYMEGSGIWSLPPPAAATTNNEDNLTIIDPNKMVSPFKRTVYFGECGHRADCYINEIKLHTYYYCKECVLFRRIVEIQY